MTRQQINEELNKIFRVFFDDETITVNDETTATDIEDWDSLSNIGLTATIEERFEIEFDMSEVNGMQNVGVMVDIILSRTPL